MAIHFLAASMAAWKALYRLCPGCRHKQLVPPAKKNDIVRCEKCGSSIPPKPAEAP